MNRLRMRDKSLKKHAAVICLAAAAGILLCNLILSFFLRQMEEKNSEAFAALLGNVKAKYPDIAEEEWISMLNSGSGCEEGWALLERYGIFEGNAVLLAGGNIKVKLFFCLNAVLLVTCIGVTIFLAHYFGKHRARIRQMEAYVHKLGQGKYALDITENEEDALSDLKNELYKITVMLKENADLQMRQKSALADSLADISHQLKTPLTSVMVLLDNLLESSRMEEQTRTRFLTEITRQLENINWLVAALLKLSRLDAGVVEFERQQVDVDVLLFSVTEKLKLSAERRHVRIKREGEKKAVVAGDFGWLAEAVTNIVKNAIEHSYANSEIIISVKTNAVYTAISVRDFGEGIDEEERKHIFERFYHSGYTNEDSVGIGLSLAKEIIERQHGYLTVEAKEQGVLFQIKFLKN